MEKKNNLFDFKIPVLVILCLIAVAGFYSYRNIQISLFPEKTFPKIKVIADAGEQPVELMMANITVPLENAVKHVEGVELVRSTTSRGSCEISIYLSWSVDMEVSLQRVNSRINQIQTSLLPNTSLSVEKMSPSILPVMDYAIVSSSKDLIELRKLALYTIRPYLATVKGVSDIQIMGGRTKEYWIILDPEKLIRLNVTPDQVANALNNTNFISSSGLVQEYHRLYLTLNDASLVDKKDIEKIVIRNDAKRKLTIDDIADVEAEEQIEYTRINANGNETVLINIVKQPSANLIGLSGEIKQKVSELEKILPHGVKLKPLYVQADFVQDAIKSVTDAILIGLLLAVAVAILFLRSLKASVVILITIPIILTFSILILNLFGYTLNIMTLGGIAASIGLIIDDAIVIVEQIHKLEEEKGDDHTSVHILHAIKYLFPAMLGSSLSTVVIFIPFFLMSGVAGAFFKVLAATMVITLVCSFLVTWIGLPVIYHSLPFKKNKTSHSTHPTAGKWLTLFIAKPILSIILAVLLFLSIFLIYNNLETGFLPEMDEGSIVLDYNSPPGTSLDETNAILNKVDEIIKSIPEVEGFSRRTGAQLGFFITEPNSGDYLIQLNKVRDRSTEEVIDDIRNKIETTQPGLIVDFGQVLGDMLGDLMSEPNPVEIKVFGNDPERLRILSEKVGEIVENVKGTEDVFNGITIAGPSAVFKPKIDELSTFGLTPADLQNQINLKLGGTPTGYILEKSQFVSVRLKFNQNLNSIKSLEQSPVFTADGKQRQLIEFTNIELKEGEAEIERENLQPMVSVTASLFERDLGSVIKEIQEKINSEIKLEQGEHIEYGGAYEQQQKSFHELLLILISATVLVFLVLLFLYKDFKASLIILLISVLGVSGSFIALYITKTPLNVGSYTGIIMIVGIIAENSIFTFQQFMIHNQTASVVESIEFAISARIRPKLMTATGAIIALLPLALGIGTGAELHQPLAIAVIGGFCAALPLLLLVLPGLLKIFYKD